MQAGIGLENLFVYMKEMVRVVLGGFILLTLTAGFLLATT
tara:strand:+ start:336 stop:455 length:120 start_codon:yes stop_codon:yes gene_type:complete